jgi:hypothetical protein
MRLSLDAGIRPRLRLGIRTSEIRARIVVSCAWVLAPLACARGIDNPLDEFAGDASPPVGVGTGTPSTVGPGSVMATSAASGGAGGSIGVTSATGGGGSSGGEPSTGAGGANGVGGAAVTSGAGATGGASAGGGGAGGAIGSGGAGGTAGGAGTGGSAGADGGVDAGTQPRPTAVRLGSVTTPSGQQSASVGGSAFSQPCAANEVIIGYTGTIDAPDAAMNQLRSFQAVCASLSVSGTTSFAVHTTTKEILPVVGTMPGASQQTEMCPTDQIVVGFSGRSGSDIDQIVALCAPFKITGSSPSYTLSLGTETANLPVGGPGGNPFAAIHCPSGQVAMGDEGRAAFTINAFGLLCATPTLEVK